MHYLCKEKQDIDMIYPQNFESKIGFDEIRALLQQQCLSSLGKERVGQMTFLTDVKHIREKQEHTREFLRIMEEEDLFPDQYFFDVRDSVKRIRIEGTYLDEQELFDLKRSLETIAGIVSFLHKGEEEICHEDEENGEVRETVYNGKYPALHRLAAEVMTFPHLARRIDEILDKYGKIKDQASPELARIRREIVVTESGISKSLQAILRNAKQDGLVEKDEQVTNAWANVQTQYQRRADLVPNLVATVKGYAQHEQATLQGVVEARAKATQLTVSAEDLTPERLSQIEAAQGELSSALGRLLLISEQYPQLRASENFSELQAQLEGTENRITESRRLYNEAVRVYNLSVRRFPGNLFAGMFGFERKASFEAQPDAATAPKVEF